MMESACLPRRTAYFKACPHGALTISLRACLILLIWPNWASLMFQFAKRFKGRGYFMLKSLMIAATAPLALFFAMPAQAETVHYSAKLDGASEVPPTTTKGTGE